MGPISLEDNVEYSKMTCINLRTCQERLAMVLRLSISNRSCCTSIIAVVAV